MKGKEQVKFVLRQRRCSVSPNFLLLFGRFRVGALFEKYLEPRILEESSDEYPWEPYRHEVPYQTKTPSLIRSHGTGPTPMPRRNPLEAKRTSNTGSGGENNDAVKDRSMSPGA